MDSPKNMTCSRCGSPNVIFIRRYSGELLCENCLRDSLLSRMRRTVSKYGLLSREDSILFLRTKLPYAGILFDLFIEMESKFPVKISSIDLDFKSRDEIVDLLREASRNLISSREKVVLPLILDDAVSLLLRSIFTGSPDFLIISGRLYFLLNELSNFVAPFIEIPVEELSVLCGGSGYEVRDPYMRMVEELEEESPGIRFNILRFMERADFLRAMGLGNRK